MEKYRQGCNSRRRQCIDFDDWIETGAQLNAAIFLIEQLKAKVIGATCINMDEAAKSNVDIPVSTVL